MNLEWGHIMHLQADGDIDMSWWNDTKNAVPLTNFIIWMSGYLHLDTVKAFVSPDSFNSPEKGFWEVETLSLRDFPQQLRNLECEMFAAKHKEQVHVLPQQYMELKMDKRNG